MPVSWALIAATLNQAVQLNDQVCVPQHQNGGDALAIGGSSCHNLRELLYLSSVKKKKREEEITAALKNISGPTKGYTVSRNIRHSLYTLNLFNMHFFLHHVIDYPLLGHGKLA